MTGAHHQLGPSLGSATSKDCVSVSAAAKAVEVGLGLISELFVGQKPSNSYVMTMTITAEDLCCGRSAPCES